MTICCFFFSNKLHFMDCKSTRTSRSIISVRTLTVDGSLIEPIRVARVTKPAANPGLVWNVYIFIQRCYSCNLQPTSRKVVQPVVRFWSGNPEKISKKMFDNVSLKRRTQKKFPRFTKNVDFFKKKWIKALTGRWKLLFERFSGLVSVDRNQRCYDLQSSCIAKVNLNYFDLIYLEAWAEITRKWKCFDANSPPQTPLKKLLENVLTCPGP